MTRPRASASRGMKRGKKQKESREEAGGAGEDSMSATSPIEEATPTTGCQEQRRMEHPS